MHFVRIGLGINVSKYTKYRQKLPLSKRLATQINSSQIHNIFEYMHNLKLK